MQLGLGLGLGLEADLRVRSRVCELGVWEDLGCLATCASRVTTRIGQRGRNCATNLALSPCGKGYAIRARKAEFVQDEDMSSVRNCSCSTLI